MTPFQNRTLLLLKKKITFADLFDTVRAQKKRIIGFPKLFALIGSGSPESGRAVQVEDPDEKNHTFRVIKCVDRRIFCSLNNFHPQISGL